MREQIHEAFSEIHASEALKAQTKDAVFRRMERRAPRRPAWVLAVCAACVLLIASGGIGYRLYAAPTAVISIDVNPSLELGVNRFDRVVSVTGMNADGQALAERLDVKNLPYEEAVQQTLASEPIQSCLDQGEQLSVAVVPDDPEQGDAILRYVSHCTRGEENAHCFMMDGADRQAAHARGMSCGEYAAAQGGDMHTSHHDDTSHHE